MQTTTEKERICPFCGKTIYYTIIEEDGVDWEGHHRGSYSSRTEGEHCECEKLPFKKMCLNCQDNAVGFCVNEDIVNTIKEKVGEETPFYVKHIETKIKDQTKHCEHWHLNTKLISNYFST